MDGTPLAGRVALVTGAGTGLGSAIVRRLATSGADVALQFRTHRERAGSIAEETRAMGRRAIVLEADFLRDPGEAAALVEATVAALGRIDVLVANAALTDHLAPLATMPRAMFEETLAANVTAPFLAIQAAARHMAAAGRGGRIITIGSVHGRQSAPDHAAYEASKGALEALTRAAAIALGSDGITVNCVAPGAIVVERYGDAWDEDWFISRTPMGRNGVPDDIAAVVGFLASDGAGFITGETIVVDGGMTRRMPLVR
jgi:NAD(P)-dependent dehydrogenase (short-subunit alcohol dehydrogenase family)